MTKSLRGKFAVIIAILVGIFLLGNITTEVVYGEGLITHITQIIDKHVYYVNDEQVSEEEFNNAQGQIETETIENIIEHRIYIDNIYKINGKIVTKEEFDDYYKSIIDANDNYSTVTITNDDLNVAGIARLSDYVSLSETECKIYSDKVVKVQYNYSANYLANFSGNVFMSNGLGCLIYQDTSKTDGLYFSVGQVVEDGYTLVTEKQLTVNDYVFKIVQNDNFANISFNDIFESITLYVAK